MVTVVAITEGVDRNLLLKEVANNHLVWWKQALDNGTFFDIDCGPAPYEPSNLTTALTGVGRGEHGCYSYWQIRSPNGSMPRILDSKDVKAPRVWLWNSLKDLRFAVVNVQLTHPPQPLNGVLLSYLMNQSLHFTYPPELRNDLYRRGYSYGHDVCAFYRGEPLDIFARDIFRIARLQLEAAIALAANCDVLIVNLTIVDRLSHFLWSQLNESENKKPLPHILAAYDFIDKALARLHRLTNYKDPMIVLSENGFGPLVEFVSLDIFLQQSGFQCLDSSGEVDESRSVAREAVQGSHGIILLDNAAKSKAALSEVQEALLSFRFLDSSPVVAAVWPREELYHGPWTCYAPELVIEPADPARPPLGDPRWARHVNRSLQTGWHRNEGFVLVLGANIIADSNKPAQLETIAPTIAYLMGRDQHQQCRAEPLAVR